MRKISWVSAVIALGALSISGARPAQANIINWNCANDGDGAINCVVSSWQDAGGGNYNMGITGDQFWGPGHMVGTFTTDSPADPTLFVEDTIGNDTPEAWSSYQVDVELSFPFTLSMDQVNTPGGWTATPAPTVPVAYNAGLGMYVGTFDMTGTPTLPVGGTLDFQYKMSFIGHTSFEYCEQLTPMEVPEPASLGLVTFFGIGLLARRHRKN